METKKFYHSKTMWIMALALIGSIVSGLTGQDWVDGEIQIALLSIIGLILRIVTKEPLS